jgi:hypothetical protein
MAGPGSEIGKTAVEGRGVKSPWSRARAAATTDDVLRLAAKALREQPAPEAERLVGDALRPARPTTLRSASYAWRSAYARILAQAKNHSLRQIIFDSVASS